MEFVFLLDLSFCKDEESMAIYTRRHQRYTMAYQFVHLDRYFWIYLNYIDFTITLTSKFVDFEKNLRKGNRIKQN